MVGCLGGLLRGLALTLVLLSSTAPRMGRVAGAPQSLCTNPSLTWGWPRAGPLKGQEARTGQQVGARSGERLR